LSKIEKTIKRLKRLPADFTYNEMETLLRNVGFDLYNKGKSSGSRIMFKKDEVVILLHKPHPQNELKRYQLKQVLEILEKENLI